MASPGNSPVVARVGPSLTLYTLLRTHLDDVRAAGYDVVCVCDDDEWADRLRHVGIEVVPLGMGRRPTPLAVLKWALRLYRYLRKAEVDVLHTSNAFHGFAARGVGRLAGVPVIVHTVHNWFHLQPGTRLAPIYGLLERIGARWGDAVFFVGRDDLAQAEEARIVPIHKRIFIGDGVSIAGLELALSLADRTHSRRALGFLEDEFVIAMVARTEPPKDHQLFIDAFEILATLRPTFRALLIGDGPAFDTVKRRVDASPFSERVLLLGNRTDVPALLQASDMLVLTSAYEAFGRSLVEGMIAGIPVIGTDVRGIRHVIEHGRTGLLVDYGDTTGLVDAVMSLVTQPSFASSLTEAARTHAALHFDEADVSRRVCQAYGALSESRTNRRRQPQALLQPLLSDSAEALEQSLDRPSLSPLVREQR